ncbi:hypothetical protein NKH94_14665 [Mesorhizobium australicum]|uniref:hypothetical protein n=1 Tax=Mesorhizobium australicum TaxID=536018 RepID=UPI00333C5038
MNEQGEPVPRVVEGGVKLSDIYREQYAHFRSMNDILYKIPPLFTVALGGLWYFATSQMRVDKAIAIGVFVFGAILSLAFINIIGRFGRAFNGYLDNLNKLDGDYKVTIKPSKLPSTVKTIQYLLWVGAAVSLVGAGYAAASSSTIPQAPANPTIPAMAPVCPQ